MAEKQVTEARVLSLISEGLKAVITPAQISKMIEEKIANLANGEDVLKLAENLKNFVTHDHLKEQTSELITKDQWNEALDGMLTASTPVTLSGIHPGFASGLTLLEPIAAEWLEGLVFRSARTKKTDSGTVNHPTERPLTPGDVLNWNDNGDTVSFVTADGQKYTIDKE